MINEVGDILRNRKNKINLDTNEGLIAAIMNLGKDNLKKLGFDDDFLKEIQSRAEMDKNRFSLNNRFENQKKSQVQKIQINHLN